MKISFITCAYRPESAEKLKESVTKSLGEIPEFVVIENEDRKYNIFEAYDEGGRKAGGDVLCFVHDDVEILSSSYWLDDLEELMKLDDTGICGVAGSLDLGTSGIWWEQGNRLSGCAMHEHKGQKAMTSFGGPFGRVLTVDGVIFFIKKDIYRKLEGYKYNKLDGFNFYDIDICMRAHWKGFKNYTFPLLILHQSIGETTENWENNRQKWVSRHLSRLPVHLQQGK